MKRAADTATFKATEPKATRTPVHEPAKPDSTSTRSSSAPEKSAVEARKSTGGPYSKQMPPPPPPRRLHRLDAHEHCLPPRLEVDNIDGEEETGEDHDSCNDDE
jgi:hypothetical protein